MKRTAFMAGGTGALGLNLVERLIDAGWDVTAMHRPGSNLLYLSRFPVRRVVGHLEDAESLSRAMPEGVDAVFHVAADVSFWAGHKARQRRTNVDGTRNVVEAALSRGAGRFVHTSTMGVFGVRDDPFDEASEKRGRTSWISYFRTKAEAEEIVLEAVGRGLDAVLLNPSNIVGPYDTNNWGRMFRMSAQGRLPGMPKGRASFCSATEVARAHLAAFERGRTGENYLLGGAEASYLDAARLVAELLGRPRRPVALPGAVIQLVGRVSSGVARLTGRPPDITPEIAEMICGHQIIRSDKAVKELGYRTVGLRTMFEDCHRWLRTEGLIPPASSPTSPVGVD